MINSLFDSSFAPALADPTVAPQTLCPSDLPLVLLPVRLETRFFTVGGATELRVRIYPDKIHVDTHQPELTTDERTWGTQYWQQDWLAGNDTTARTNAWRTLAGRFGAPRAAWISRVLQPTNLAQRPTTPVPTGTPPAFPPVFPTLPPIGLNGESAWRHAPTARLLPDRWMAIVHSAGRVALTATGSDITRPLAVGPDPSVAAPDAATDAAIAAGDQLALDEGMMWMVDFTKAEAKGMALRIPIPAATLAAKLDSLLVFGVAKSLSVADTASQLADLLDAHHYTDGLEFLRFGAPTNNTDDRRTAYSTEDPGHTRSFATEVLADPNNAPNGTRVGTALGLPFARIAPTLGRVGQAAQDHDRDLRSMNTALWQVGWGYYLTNMIGSQTGVAQTSVDWARGYFINHVRTGGPLPSFRCGSQPYGILPVTSLDAWVPGATETVAPEESWLQKFLINLRDNVWRPVASTVARVGLRQDPADPDADLADVMRTDGVSHETYARGVMGRHYVEHLFRFGAQDFTGLAQTQDAAASQLLKKLGITPPTPPHRASHSFIAPPIQLTAPLIQLGEVSPWQLLQPNYIGALLAAPTIQALIDARPGTNAVDRTTSFLQMLLRHAMLREIATAAARIAATIPGNSLPQLLRDLELVDLVDSPLIALVIQTPAKNMHWRRQLDLVAPTVTGTNTIRTFLEGLTTFTTQPVTALGEFRASLTHLQTLDSESLQFLTQGTLDLSAHRLDAWITSYATKRLAAMSVDGPKGQYVGAYGWVENLKPADPLTPLTASALPAGETGLVYPLAKDSGFIHAPSLTHASTAALLRNAHLGPEGKPGPTGPFAIDLSSRRVREASRILDGVREGQPLTALLGYQLERRLHDLSLDIFIAPLRRIAPLVVRKREDTNAPAEALAADNVVDAQALLRFQQVPGDQTVANALASVPSTGPQQLQALNEIAVLANTVDGLSDALTAEAAYQLVRGNTSRLASTLSAIAHGDALPPELEVARMPRTGTPITHRVVVLFSGASNAGRGWTATNTRSTLERWLGTWVRAQLGDANLVRCTVEKIDDATGAVVQTIKFMLQTVTMSALDFVYYTQPASQSSTDSSALCIVEQMVLYTARRMTGGFGADGTIRIQHARPTDLGVGETTLFDVLGQARALRRLLERGRGLRPEDLSPADRTSTATINLADLQGRVVHYESSCNAAHVALTNLVAHAATTVADTMRTAMLTLGMFGIPQAVPNIAVGDTPDIRTALATQAAAMLKISKQRLDKSKTLNAQTAATDQRVRCDQLIARARAIYGDEFICLPNFTCDATRAAELNSAAAASTQQQGGDPLAVHGWFARASRVRDPLARLGDCLQGAEVLATGTRLALTVAQLPFDAAERWVGLPPIPPKELPQNKLSLVMQLSGAFNATLPLCGLFIDEWVDVVPNQKETTALTFQFDPPNSFAPQNVLVAVPPVPGQDWTTESLRQVLVETLDLAKLRAVDTSRLGAAAQYLPALYLPFNAADDAVSTDFSPLTAPQPFAPVFASGITIVVASPTANATLGRTAQISGFVNPFSGSLTSVTLQFEVGGPIVHTTLQGFAWSWQGTIPNNIRPGQSFQLVIAALGVPAAPLVQALGQTAVNVVLENVVPVLTVDPFPSSVTVTAAPYATTLSGTISEGTGAPYAPQVQFRVGTAALTTITPAQGKWSVPLSLPAGDNVLTVQASDAFASVTAFQKTLTVVVKTP